MYYPYRLIVPYEALKMINIKETLKKRISEENLGQEINIRKIKSIFITTILEFSLELTIQGVCCVMSMILMFSLFKI